MKKVIPLFLVIVVSQSYGQQAPKKANTITVTTPDDIEIVFSKYEEYLEDEGFIIRSKEELLNLQTSAKERTFGALSSYSVYVEFHLQFEKSEENTIVIITGNYIDAGGMGKTRPISNKGNSRMGVGLAWQIMNNLAIRYPGGKLSYSIE